MEATQCDTFESEDCVDYRNYRDYRDFGIWSMVGNRLMSGRKQTINQSNFVRSSLGGNFF